MHINRNLITSAAICALMGVAVATRSEAQGGAATVAGVIAAATAASKQDSSRRTMPPRKWPSASRTCRRRSR